MSVPIHDMGRHMQAAEETGKPLKIAVMLGNHPAMAMFAATPSATTSPSTATPRP